MRRLGVVLAVAAGIGVVVAAMFAWRMNEAPAPAPTGVAASVQIGGPFSLVDVNGRPVTERDLTGKPAMVYFGFTFCPEVCPTTLADMSRWLKALGPDADRLNTVFVTIDPQRDSPRQLATYLSSFDPHIRGLTGTPAQIADTAKRYRVYVQKVPLAGGGYTMDHSTSVYLMGRDGKLADLIGYQEPEASAVAKIRRLVAG